MNALPTFPAENEVIEHDERPMDVSIQYFGVEKGIPLTEQQLAKMPATKFRERFISRLDSVKTPFIVHGQLTPRQIRNRLDELGVAHATKAQILAVVREDAFTPKYRLIGDCTTGKIAVVLSCADQDPQSGENLTDRLIAESRKKRASKRRR